jgi:PST family polysaccharide transporter
MLGAAMPSLSRSTAVRSASPAGGARGLSLILAGNLVQSALRLLLAAFTARLVAPGETGLFQLAFSVTMLALALGDPGLSEAMVRRRRQSRAGASTFFWANLAMAAATGLGLLLLAGPLAQALGAPASAPLIAAMAGLPLLWMLALAPFVELRRQLRFGDIAVIETAACMVGCVACLVAARLGAGAWSLAWFQFGWYGVRAGAGLILAPTRPRPVFRPRAIRRAAWFAASVWGARIATALATQLDKVIIGALLGAASLGLYSRGALFLSIPLQMLTTATSTALVPSFAQLRAQPDALAGEFVRSSQVVAVLALPAFVGAGLLAGPIVDVILGRGPSWDWAPVADILPILAIGGVAECLNRPQRALLVALGRAGTALALTFAGAVALLAGVAAGAWAAGLIGAAIGYAAASALMFVPAAIFAMRRAKVSIRAYVGGLAPILAATGAMAVAVLAARAGLNAMGAGPLVHLLALPPVGAAVYGAVLGRRGWRLLREVMGAKAKPPAGGPA